jgi:uncharacterized membrane protein (UPF0127 family)
VQRIAAALALLALFSTPSACSRRSTSSAGSGTSAELSERAGRHDAALPVARIALRPAGGAEVSVQAELALTEAERELGLMNRTALDERAGMLFVYPAPRHLTFWMRNTLLPLDMIFITSEHRVLGVVENATPMTDDLRQVPGDAQFVLEVRGGFAARHRIAAGAEVEMPDLPPGQDGI